MAGGGFSGLTSQTSRSLSCGSDRISSRNPARPNTTVGIKFENEKSDKHETNCNFNYQYFDFICKRTD